MERAVALQPKSVDAQIALGIARLRSGDAQSGLKSFRRAVELDASSAEAHYNLGLALRESGQAAAALTEFATAVRLVPTAKMPAWPSRWPTSRPENWIRRSPSATRR